MLTGVVLIVLGGLAIACPAVAGTAVSTVIGALLALAGIALLIHGWRSDGWRNRLIALILGAVTTLGGIAVITNPLLGLGALALILALYFLAEGTWKIVVSFSYRPASGWLAMLLSGVLALILGWLIWRQWPLSGLWAVGVLVGVNLLTTGAALVALAITIRQLKRLVQDAVAA
jgi:uncharacterized membrane protein HdeD (DUF308 family)